MYRKALNFFKFQEPLHIAKLRIFQSKEPPYYIPIFSSIWGKESFVHKFLVFFSNLQTCWWLDGRVSIWGTEFLNYRSLQPFSRTSPQTCSGARRTRNFYSQVKSNKYLKNFRGQKTRFIILGDIDKPYFFTTLPL